MATLAGNSIASSYTSLLKLDGNTDSTAAGNGSNAIQVKTGDNDATPLFLNTDRLGIGTANVESLLHVQSDTAAQIQIHNTSSGNAPKFLFDGLVGANADYVLGSLRASWDTHTNIVSEIRFESGVDTANKDDGQITFWTSPSSSTVAERLRINQDGHVGINISSPDVWSYGTKTLALSGGSTANAYPAFNIGSYSTSTTGIIADINFTQFTSNGSTGAERAIVRAVNDGATDSIALKFYTTPTGGSVTERMIIASDGNASIGTTAKYGNLTVGGTGELIAGRASSGAGSFSMYESGTTRFVIESLNGSNGVAFKTPSTARMILDDNSRISLSNNDSGGTGGRDSTSGNTVLGYHAGNNIASGSVVNTFIGHASGSGSLDSAQNNVGVGAETLQALTTGDSNTVMGAYSGFAITTGEDNVIIGTDAGFAVTTQSNLVLIGRSAGDAINHNDANGTVAIGEHALGKATSAIGNTAIGLNALAENTTGDNNIAIGYNAMNSQQAGGAQDVSATSHNNTYIGVDAGGGNYIDAQSNYNVGIGNGALGGALSSSNSNTAIGFGALNANTQGDNNVAIGYASMGTGATTGSNNVAIGRQTLEDATSATDNTFLGHQSAANMVTGNTNVAVGRNALVSATACTDVVSIGAYSMDAVTTSTDVDGTVAIGKHALSALTSGAGNTAVGYQALTTNVDGDRNTAVGYGALASHEADTDGHGENTSVGYQAGGDVSTGTGNTFIGSRAGNQGTNDITTGDNNTLIGVEAKASGAGGNNQIAIGHSATGQADNSVTLGNGDVTAVYMAQDSAAIVHAGGIRTGPSAMLGVGQTPADENSSEVGPGYLNLFRDDTASVKQILFGKNGSEVGSISTDGSNTAFNTSSDYRLKENEFEIPDGLERLNKLKPYRFNWKSENDEDGKPTRTVDGLFAHEVAEIIPEAVIGKKDAVDSNGKMKIQSMDYSKVVPLLIKAVQELSAKVAELENK